MLTKCGKNVILLDEIYMIKYVGDAAQIHFKNGNGYHLTIEETKQIVNKWEEYQKSQTFVGFLKYWLNEYLNTIRANQAWTPNQITLFQLSLTKKILGKQT